MWLNGDIMHPQQRIDKQREQSRKAIEEHKQREELFQQEHKKRASKKRVILFASIGVVVLIIAGIAFAVLTPGKYDNFAKCLTEKGAVMQGEDWCQYTNAQKGMFGKSFKYINYHVKTGLNKRPTWIINGQTYETVQSFERLAALTGCSYN